METYPIYSDHAIQIDTDEPNTKHATLETKVPTLEELQNEINVFKANGGCTKDLSDTYHTFGDLYHHRALLFASLCLTSMRSIAWKSLLHDDPNDKMYDGMFIVGVETPEGQATYHYKIDPYWAMFKGVKELDRAPKYDGHTPDEAIQRIYNYATNYLKPTLRSADARHSDSNIVTHSNPDSITTATNWENNGVNGDFKTQTIKSHKLRTMRAAIEDDDD